MSLENSEGHQGLDDKAGLESRLSCLDIEFLWNKSSVQNRDFELLAGPQVQLENSHFCKVG